MAGTWDEWLAQLARDNQGGSALAVPAITRGLAHAIGIDFAANWSADAFAATLRAGVDASGAALATFTCSVGGYSGGLTRVTLSLTGVQTAALPVDADGNGLEEFVWELLRTPSGGAQARVAAGVISVSGRA